MRIQKLTGRYSLSNLIILSTINNECNWNINHVFILCPYQSELILHDSKPAIWNTKQRLSHASKNSRKAIPYTSQHMACVKRYLNIQSHTRPTVLPLNFLCQFQSYTTDSILPPLTHTHSPAKHKGKEGPMKNTLCLL